MKIVFVSRLYLPHLGGVEVHLKEISALLTREGHEVTVITLQHEKKLKLETELDGVKIIRVPYECSENKQKTWDAIRSCKEVFFDADIVHVHDVFWWILPIYTKIKQKIYITFHGWETKLPIPMNAKIHRFLVSKLVQGSLHVGAFIQKFYWDKPNAVIYGGINAKRFTRSTETIDSETSKNNSTSNILRFVFIGRLDPDTDVRMYLEFLKRLRVKRIPFTITWVGDGSLKQSCETFGTVTGFVKNISKYILQADFVFASSYLSILEAQCLEKIVLSFYSNELKKEYLETFPGSKFMLISGSVDTMLKKIEHLLTSRRFVDSLKVEASKFAQTYTWDKVLVEYKRLWQNSFK